MGLSFAIAAGPRQRSHSRVRTPRNSWSHFTVLISRLPNLEGYVPVFISPRNRVAQLYPQATTRRVTVDLFEPSCSRILLIHPWGGRKRKRRFHRYSSTHLEFCYFIRCRGNAFKESLPSNERLLWLSGVMSQYFEYELFTASVRRVVGRGSRRQDQTNFETLCII
jgi:hypothetical protein